MFVVAWFTTQGTKQNTRAMTDTELADTDLRFAVFMTGSNKLVAANLVIRLNSKNVLESSTELQRQVAALEGVQLHQCIKVMLGSPAGPQLSPLLRSLDTVLQGLKNTPQEELLDQKVMISAWMNLQPDKVNIVFVTQHKHSAVVVDQLVSTYAKGYTSHAYNRLPRADQCNPDVFSTAHILSCGRIGIPDELKNNKKLALNCFMRWSAYLGYLDLSDFGALNDDEDVVFAAVALYPQELFFASQRLKASKAFVLKAVNMNGICIKWAAPELQQDKEVALAAVRQNRAAIKYLCAELIEDKDIQQACTSNSES